MCAGSVQETCQIKDAGDVAREHEVCVRDKGQHLLQTQAQVGTRVGKGGSTGGRKSRESDLQVAQSDFQAGAGDALTTAAGSLVDIALSSGTSDEKHEQLALVAANLGKDLFVTAISVKMPILGTLVGIGMDALFPSPEATYMSKEDVEAKIEQLRRELVPEMHKIATETTVAHIVKNTQTKMILKMREFKRLWNAVDRNVSVLSTHMVLLTGLVNEALGQCHLADQRSNCNTWLQHGGLACTVTFINFYIPVATEFVSVNFPVGSSKETEQVNIKLKLTNIKTALKYMIAHSMQQRLSMIRRENLRADWERRDHTCLQGESNWRGPALTPPYNDFYSHYDQVSVNRKFFGIKHASEGRRRHNMREHGPVSCCACKEDVWDRGSQTRVELEGIVTIWGNYGEYDRNHECRWAPEYQGGFIAATQALTDDVRMAHEKTVNAAMNILNPLRKKYDWDFRGCSQNVEGSDDDAVAGRMHGAVCQDDGVVMDGLSNFVQYDPLNWGGEEFSIEFLVRHEASRTWARIFDCGNGPGQDNIILTNVGQGNTFNVQIWNANSLSELNVANGLQVGGWTHGVVTRSTTGTSRVYINGYLVVTSGTSLSLHRIERKTRSQCFSGKSNWGADQLFKGKLAYLRLYERVVSANDVKLLYGVTGLPKMPQFNWEFRSCDRFAAASWTGGASCSATGIHMNGASAYISYPAFSWDSAGFSIEFYVKYESFHTWSRIFDCGDGPEKDNIVLANKAATNTLSFQIWDGAQINEIDASNSLAANTWIHGVVTRSLSSQSNGHIYIDGALVASGSIHGPRRLERSKCFSGKSNWGADQFLKGTLAYLRLYSYALTSNEVSHLYTHRDMITWATD